MDHTHEVTKDYFYKKRLGVEALWDICTDTSKIASAVLVPSTKFKDFSHAAKQLVKREAFKPKAMYSDTWPCKSDTWSLVFNKKLEGRLGLFHFLQRILRMLRKRHVDYHTALNSLLNAVYTYNKENYEDLLRALKGGGFGIRYDNEDIVEMRLSKTFCQRYDKFLRKEIRSPETLRSLLDEWFDRFKCASSSTARPALACLLRGSVGAYLVTKREGLSVSPQSHAWVVV